MDTLWAFLIIFGNAALIYLFSLGVGVATQRWSDSAGLDDSPRVSTARLAAGLACIIFGASLGAFVATIHLVLLALTVPIAVGGLVAGILILKRGEAPPPPAPPAPRAHAGPKHAGLGYFWHCWIPVRVHDYTRPMLLALFGPPVAVVMFVLERWVPAGVFAGLSVLCWVLLLTVKPKSTPRRGPCARAE